MDAAAVAIPIPVQTNEPQPPTPGTDAPAEGKEGIVDFASALEAQIAQAAAPGVKIAALKLPAADRDTDREADSSEKPPREDTPDPAVADGLIAMMSAPLGVQAPQTLPTGATGALPAAGAGPAPTAIAHAHAQPAPALQRDGAPEPRPAPQNAASPPLAAAADPQRSVHPAERDPAPTTPLPSALASDAPLALPVALPQAAPAVAPPAVAHTISHPGPQIAARVGTAEWGDGLAQQVTLMVKDGEHTAQLRLDPPDLGPLEVRLSMARNEDGVAHAQFVSPHAAVRDALEAALPQLRAVLADNGITLGQASVGEGFARQDAREPRQSAGRGSGERGSDALDTIAAPRAVVRHGLVDTFA